MAPPIPVSMFSGDVQQLIRRYSLDSATSGTLSAMDASDIPQIKKIRDRDTLDAAPKEKLTKLINVIESATVTSAYDGIFSKKTVSCRDVAAAKLQSQAKSYGLEVDMGSMRLSDIDEGAWWDLFSYHWWSVDVIDSSSGKEQAKELTKMTQEFLGECF